MVTESLWNLSHHCHCAIAMFVCIFLDQKFRMQDIPSVSGIPTGNISTPLCIWIQWVTKHKLLLKRHIIHLWKCVVPPGPPGEIMQAKDTISMSDLWGPQCSHSRQDMALFELDLWRVMSRAILFKNDAPYNDVLMSATASHITSVSIVCSTVCSSADQRKHQSSASLVFVRGIHRWPVDSSHKGPATRKMLQFVDVIMPCVRLSPSRTVRRTLIFVKDSVAQSLTRQTVWV